MKRCSSMNAICRKKKADCHWIKIDRWMIKLKKKTKINTQLKKKFVFFSGKPTPMRFRTPHIHCLCATTSTC